MMLYELILTAAILILGLSALAVLSWCLDWLCDRLEEIFEWVKKMMDNDAP